MKEFPMMYLLLLALVGWSIQRQMTAQAVGALANDLRKPLIFAVIAVATFSDWRPATALDWELLAGSLALSAVTGVARGALMPIWREADGGVWRKGNAVTLGLWGAMIAGKVALGVLVAQRPPHAGEVLLFLGVSIAVQLAVIAARADAVRRPRPVTA
jgi:hypothetical protein